MDPPGLVATPVIPTPRGEVGDSGQHHRQLYSEFKASPGGLHKIEYKVKCPITKNHSGFSWKDGKTGEGSILSVDQWQAMALRDRRNIRILGASSTQNAGENVSRITGVEGTEAGVIG